jgi:hypothetical protein
MKQSYREIRSKNSFTFPKFNLPQLVIPKFKMKHKIVFGLIAVVAIFITFYIVGTRITITYGRYEELTRNYPSSIIVTKYNSSRELFGNKVTVDNIEYEFQSGVVSGIEMCLLQRGGKAWAKYRKK